MDGPRQPTEDQAVHAYYILYILLSALQYAVLLYYYYYILRSRSVKVGFYAGHSHTYTTVKIGT